MAERKRIYLCLAHMSDDGAEQKYVKEAFDTNWVVPLGPNVNGFEKDLERFVNTKTNGSNDYDDNQNNLDNSGTRMTTNGHELNINKYDSNYWLCTITIDPEVRVKGQENAYKTIVTGAVGGAAGVIHAASSATTDCQPNDNVEAMRVCLDKAGIEARPVWKPMHKQPVYCAPLNEKGKMINEKLPSGAICQTSGSSVAYINGVSEAIFKVGMCLPAGPYVRDDDVRYIVETIKESIL